MHKQMILPNVLLCEKYCCTSQPLREDGRFVATLENYKQKKHNTNTKRWKKTTKQTKTKQKRHMYIQGAYT